MHLSMQTNSARCIYVHLCMQELAKRVEIERERERRTDRQTDGRTDKPTHVDTMWPRGSPAPSFCKHFLKNQWPKQNPHGIDVPEWQRLLGRAAGGGVQSVPDSKTLKRTQQQKNGIGPWKLFWETFGELLNTRYMIWGGAKCTEARGIENTCCGALSMRLCSPNFVSPPPATLWISMAFSIRIWGILAGRGLASSSILCAEVLFETKENFPMCLWMSQNLNKHFER